MSQHSYAVLGAGAIGGFYGARLQRAGLDVHFLLHSDYEHVRTQGLCIESMEGDFALPDVHAYQDVRDMPPCDVVLIALKTTQNHLLPHMLPWVSKNEGVVLVLQNGLGTEAEIARLVDATRVMGGLCFICSHKISPGHIHHLDYGSITLAEYTAAQTAKGITVRMRQIASDFERAGIPIILAPDLQVARWKKLVWNIPFNSLTVIFDTTTQQIMSNHYTRTLVEQLMEEVIADAAACGHIISPSFIEEMLVATDQMIPYRPSMKLDYDTHRPMEVEAIFGNPLRTAQKASVTSPRLEMLYYQLQFLNARNLPD